MATGKATLRRDTGTTPTAHDSSDERPSADTAGRRHEKSMKPETDPAAAETARTTDSPAVDLPRLIRRELEWHPGPAIGGGGTAQNEEHATHPSWWYDEQLLLVIVERNDGPELSTVRVHADGDMLDFSNAATDDFDFGWTDQDISWWAILDDILPPNVEPSYGDGGKE